MWSALGGSKGSQRTFHHSLNCLQKFSWQLVFHEDIFFYRGVWLLFLHLPQRMRTSFGGASGERFARPRCQGQIRGRELCLQ